MVYSPYQSDAVKTLGTVYVVDDDEAVRDSIRWLLEASDYRVELYDSGESFIAKYDPREIAVLLLDVRMSGMSGLEVQEHLLARRADIPIIFITGHGDVPMAVNALKKGAVDFIEKPFDPAALKQLVERMLKEAHDRRRATEQNRAEKPQHGFTAQTHHPRTAGARAHHSRSTQQTDCRRPRHLDQDRGSSPRFDHGQDQFRYRGRSDARGTRCSDGNQAGLLTFQAEINVEQRRNPHEGAPLLHFSC